MGNAAARPLPRPDGGNLVRLASAELLGMIRAHDSQFIDERVTMGFDDMLQLLGGGRADGLQTPTSLGIKIPTLPSSSNSGLPYTVLCAVADLDTGERILGFNQYLSIAAYAGTPRPDHPGTVYAPIPPVSLNMRTVVTPGWTFEDVPPVEWWMTESSIPPTRMNQGPFGNLASFVYEDCGDSGLVYSTATVPGPLGLGLLPGYMGLTAYAPPQMLGVPWYVCRDVHYPMERNEYGALEFVATEPKRIRLYARVWQTDPLVRNDDLGLTGDIAVLAAGGGLCREDLFLQVFPNIPQYRAVGARLVARKNTHQASTPLTQLREAGGDAA